MSNFAQGHTTGPRTRVGTQLYSPLSIATIALGYHVDPESQLSSILWSTIGGIPSSHSRQTQKVKRGLWQATQCHTAEQWSQVVPEEPSAFPDSWSSALSSTCACPALLGLHSEWPNHLVVGRAADMKPWGRCWHFYDSITVPEPRAYIQKSACTSPWKNEYLLTTQSVVC